MAFTESCGALAEAVDQKNAVWHALVESKLLDITEEDCAIFPRIFPRSYLGVVERTAREITEFVLRLVSLPERELHAILPPGPIRDFLIRELAVLKFRPERLTGSFRFDMAIVGAARKDNPPKLLEINEIGFDGLARSAFLQETMFELLPGLRERAVPRDAAKSEIRNMRRLGPSLARFQTDCYNWDEEYLLRISEQLGFDLRLVSPDPFHCRIGRDFPLLKRSSIHFSRVGRVRVGRDFFPSATQISYALALKDYEKNASFFGELVRAKTPQYGPFLMGLVASKTVLVLLADRELRRRLLGNGRALRGAALDAFMLCEKRAEALERPSDFVLKHADGFGGRSVFFGRELAAKVRRISEAREHEWVLQQRTSLNRIETEGVLSRRRKLISDLAVFVHYDWAGDRFRNFEVGGYISRATGKGLKVNVGSGGIQIPVIFLGR